MYAQFKHVFPWIGFYMNYLSVNNYVVHFCNGNQCVSKIVSVNYYFIIIARVCFDFMKLL